MLLNGLTAGGCSGRPENLPEVITRSGASRAPGPAGPAPHLVSGPLNGRKTGVLTVRDAASRVVVRLVNLPGQLYRVSTPAGSGLAPRVSGGAGDLRLTLRPTRSDGPDTVEVLLNRSVRWDLRLPAGAGEQHLDLTAGRLRRITLGSAAGLVSLRLPRPAGVVPITVAGPVGEFVAVAPAGSAVRLRLRRGAASVAAPWATGGAGAEPGAVLATAGYGSAARRYAIDVLPEAGVVTVRLPRRLSAGRCVPSCSAGTPGRGR